LAKLLEVKNLETAFDVDGSIYNAVDDVSFSVEHGRTLGIVGESGCGKSVTSLSVMRLIQKPGFIKSGQILFNGIDLLKLSDNEMRKIRGNKIAMIFQEPMTSLNPVFTCGEQIEEVIRLHQGHMPKVEQKQKAIEMLKKVGIPAPERRYHDYPHQLSGGMRQRVMIAMAITCNPELLIADEPTTALDVTIQAQILDLMRGLKSSENMGMILITHDLGVVAEMCDDVAVMYAGQIVEQGPVKEIFTSPKHPYTRGLLNSIPHFESGHRLKKLNTIAGMVPSLINLPKGCRFNERCDKAKQICLEQNPVLSSDSHKVACHFPEN
jgi:oligopeptide/dipeptide ABC transporter ATP-binding protein